MERAPPCALVYSIMKSNSEIMLNIFVSCLFAGISLAAGEGRRPYGRNFRELLFILGTWGNRGPIESPPDGELRQHADAQQAEDRPAQQQECHHPHTTRPTSAPVLAPLCWREGTEIPPFRTSTMPSRHPQIRPGALWSSKDGPRSP
jgi:hypothetical protein